MEMFNIVAIITILCIVIITILIYGSKTKQLQQDRIDCLEKTNGYLYKQIDNGVTSNIELCKQIEKMRTTSVPIILHEKIIETDNELKKYYPNRMFFFMLILKEIVILKKNLLLF